MVVFWGLCTDFMSSKGLFSERKHSAEFHQTRYDSLEISDPCKAGYGRNSKVYMNSSAGEYQEKRERRFNF
jgi:hypothetical protein